MKLSDVPVGKPFSGVVLSERSGQPIVGNFVKLSNKTCLVECPSGVDKLDSLNPADPRTNDILTAEGVRWIRPAVLVYVLSTAPGCTAWGKGRLPLILDDLEVLNYNPITQATMTMFFADGGPSVAVDDFTRMPCGDGCVGCAYCTRFAKLVPPTPEDIAWGEGVVKRLADEEKRPNGRLQKLTLDDDIQQAVKAATK